MWVKPYSPSLQSTWKLWMLFRKYSCEKKLLSRSSRCDIEVSQSWFQSSKKLAIKCGEVRPRSTWSQIWPLTFPSNVDMNIHFSLLVIESRRVLAMPTLARKRMSLFVADCPDHWVPKPSIILFCFFVLPSWWNDGWCCVVKNQQVLQKPHVLLSVDLQSSSEDDPSMVGLSLLHLSWGEHTSGSQFSWI